MIKTLIYSALYIFASCNINRVCRDPVGKEVDWYSIFYVQYYDFIKKVSDLIKDMKDFDILFKYKRYFPNFSNK